MTDEQWNEAIQERVRHEVRVDFQDWTTAVLRLPRPVRVYWFSWLLEAEVCNGGFIHFFLNFWGQLGGEGASCFEELGSPELAAVIRKAVAVFWGEVNTGKFADHESSEVEDAVSPLLRPFDGEFYDLLAAVDTESLRRWYLREHLLEFASFLSNKEQSRPTDDTESLADESP